MCKGQTDATEVYHLRTAGKYCADHCDDEIATHEPIHRARGLVAQVLRVRLLYVLNVDSRIQQMKLNYILVSTSRCCGHFLFFLFVWYIGTSHL